MVTSLLLGRKLFVWMPQQLSVDSFEWKKDTLRFDEDFIRNYDEDSDAGYILEVDIKGTLMQIWKSPYIFVFI